jgi:hypothetical protein
MKLTNQSTANIPGKSHILVMYIVIIGVLSPGYGLFYQVPWDLEPPFMMPQREYYLYYEK